MLTFAATTRARCAAKTLTTRCRQVCLAVAVLLSLTVSAEDHSTVELDRQFRVSYVLTGTVYLDSGRSQGLAVGQRLVVMRDDEAVAELEVQFVADASAACEIISQLRPIDPGNLVVPLLPSDQQAPAPTPTSRTAPTPAETPPIRPRQIEPPAVTAAPPEPSITRVAPPARSSPGNPWAKLSGTVSFYYQHFEDGTEAERDFAQSTLRLNLRMREINGSPYEFRARIRGRENRRTQASGEEISERRDRLYELSLTYDPEGGKLYYQVGRLRSGPLVGFDYLDGILAEYRFKPRLGIGGFFGSRSNLEELGFESEGQTYGAFLHYRRERSRESPFYADLLIGGIGEYEDGEVSREYLSIYGRMGSGSRWTFYQRADIDLNRDWRRDTSGEDYQVSNLLVSGTYRVSDGLRFGLSYDQRRRFRDLENRDTPEERFDDQLRDGARATIYIGRPQGWRATTSFGLRRQEETSEDSTTVNASVYNSDLGGRRLLLGFDYSGFSGATSDGRRLGLRLRKYFRGGHDVGLTLGASQTDSTFTDTVRENQWLRFSGTARLPKGFFVLWEVELAEGDDLEGQRTILQLGYRL